MSGQLALAGSSSWAAAQGIKPFFEGKTIQLVVAAGPGASTDIGARLVGRYLGKHIPGNPGTIVQNMPGGGGLVAANHLFNIAKPDGLTILAVSRANYLDQMVGRPEVRADFRKFGWIGSFNRAPMMIACRSDTPYKSLAAMRAAKIPPRFGQAGTGSISYVFANLISKIFDLKIKNVTGFGSGREIDLGMERGEADCRATSDITVIRTPWPQERMLKDVEFTAEAKKLLDWDGTTYLSGQQLQKKSEATVTQSPDVIKRVKEILEES